VPPCPCVRVSIGSGRLGLGISVRIRTEVLKNAESKSSGVLITADMVGVNKRFQSGVTVGEPVRVKGGQNVFWSILRFCHI